MVKNKIKMLLCAIIFISTGILACDSLYKESNTINDAQDTVYDYQIEPADDSLIIPRRFNAEAKKDSLRDAMVKEVQDFIDDKAPTAHHSIASLIVDNGLEHHIDIAFMMAQTHLETNFGTAGAGRPTSRHSLFGTNGHFKSYSDAVTSYVALLEDKYLTNGRTTQHLLNKYTTKGGHRYAKSPKYEKKLKKYYNSINNTSNIKFIQEQYEQLVM